jgi:hypothetical protein
MPARSTAWRLVSEPDEIIQDADIYLSGQAQKYVRTAIRAMKSTFARMCRFIACFATAN